MVRYIKNTSRLLAILAVMLTNYAQASQTFLYLFYDGTRAGEKNQVLGVANALKCQLRAKFL